MLVLQTLPTDMCALQDFDEPDKLQIKVNEVITVIEGRWVIYHLDLVLNLASSSFLKAYMRLKYYFLFIWIPNLNIKQIWMKDFIFFCNYFSLFVPKWNLFWNVVFILFKSCWRFSFTVNTFTHFRAENYWWRGQNKCTLQVGQFSRNVVTSVAGLSARDISRPLKNSFIHTGHGDTNPHRCWGHRDKIDE